MNKKNLKKKSKTKKYITFGIVAFFAIALVSAGLVSYLSNTVTEDITVESPFSIDETIGLDLVVGYSANDDFSLVKITNHAERDITADVEILVNPGEFGYDNVNGGIAIALTEDINYCFKGQGDMTDVTNCETDYMTWMTNNIDWNDWYANEGYNENIFFSDLVINHGGDSFFSLGYVEDSFVLPGLTFPTGETIYGIVYITTNPALEPNTYDFGMTIIPTA